METPFTWGRNAYRTYGPYASTAAQLTVVIGLFAVAVRFRQLGDAPFFWGVAVFLGLELLAGFLGISSWWRSARTLDQGGAFLRAVLDSIPASVSWVDRDLTYRGANRVLSEWLDVPEDAIIGRPLGFMSREEGRILQSLVEQAFEGENRTTQAEVPLRRKGKLTPCLVTVRRFGRGDEAVVIAVDVSEQKEIQEKLERERNRALFSAKMTTLGETAAGIAHQINNPLGIILGKAANIRIQLSQGGALDRAALDESVVKIEETVQRIARVIRALREMAHDAEGDPFVAVPLGPVLADLKEVMSARFEQRGIQFDCREGSPEIRVRGRPAQIAQVLMSLLENAYDALAHVATSPKRVQVSLEVRNGRARVLVEDNGAGVPAELHDKIFEPFFSTKKEGEGTGLSLSVARSIAKDHQGDLFLESAPGLTRFVLELPIGQ